VTAGRIEPLAAHPCRKSGDRWPGGGEPAQQGLASSVKCCPLRVWRWHVSCSR